ncbi:jerky protein homolog-like [Aphidius gifuensis]|uniref:jerky protein homolog-like n=1 Tax=Aphidius gifuensis TaxID=684658 RepID=UPI001CDBB4AE|nr:jerky protein homolog-like [Aphidius gifuensis]
MSPPSAPSTSKRKRNVLTMEKKLEILSKIDKGETSVSIASFYNIGKATVSDIKKNRGTIMSFVSKMDSDDGIKTKKVMKSAVNEKLDKAMQTWFIQKRSLNEPISGPLVCEKALEMNEKLGGTEDFKASTGWLQKFKNRHGIRELKVQGESLSADSNAAEKFKEKFSSIIDEEEYGRDDIYNADETGLNGRSLPRKSLAARQESAARGFKVSKERITIMTCANAAGTHKLPLLVIGKSKEPRCFKNVTSLPVTYTAQKSAWMDSKLFINWYENDFIKNVKKWRQENNKTGKVLLLLDNAPTHPSADVLNSIDADFRVMYFPPNVTSLIQPMDQGVIEKFKRMYRKQMLRSLLLNDGTEEGVIQFAKALTLKHCCYMAADAWDNLTEENLKKAWMKLWLEPVEVETNEETDDNVNDIVDLFNQIPGFNDCDNHDATDWLTTDENDPGYHVLDDDEIINLSQNASGNEESEESSSDESVSSSKGPSHAEAFKAFETGLEWFEKQAESCPAQLLLLKRLRDLAAKKRVATIRQTKIDHFLKQ